MEEITDNLDDNSKELFRLLKSFPCKENLEAILNKKEFNDLYDNIMLEQNGTESKMTIAYLKDVSSLLALVAAVRDCNFELHLQAEREMIKHCFAFDHVNYARYLAYQQVYLRDLERKDHPAINELKT